MPLCKYPGASVALIVFLCVQAAFAAKGPDWLGGSSKKYPADKFLIGVGLGSGLDLARSNARAEIAKIFQARIIQSSEETIREHSVQGSGNAGSTCENSNELNTRTSTDDVLQGAEIAETYFDARKQLSYALAILDKGKMRRNLAREISDLEEIIESQEVLAQKAVSVVDEIRALNKSLKTRDRKDVLLAKQRVVDPMPVPEVKTRLSRAEVYQRKEEASRKILFILASGSEDTRNLNGIIGERITGMGFNIADSTSVAGGESASLITVKSRIAVEPTERNNPDWKFYNWSANMEMSDLSNGGRVIAAVTRQGQASHVTESAARDKAVAEAAHALAVAVEQQVTQYIFGE